MDFLESVFGFATRVLKKNNQAQKASFAVSYDDRFYLLSLLVQGTDLDFSILTQPSSLKIPVVYSDCIYLPEYFDLFFDGELNRDLQAHQAMVAGAIHALGLAYSPTISKNHEKVIYIIQAIPKIREYLKAMYPSYENWSDLLLGRHFAALDSMKLSDSEWIAYDLLKGSDFGSNEVRISELQKKDLSSFPDLALAPWSELLIEEEALLPSALETKLKDRDSKSQTKTEKEGKKNPKKKRIDLENESKKENPVTHSFEKLETADEYTGGYRKVDGDDDLESHSNALDELNLDKTVQTDAEVHSIYRSEIRSQKQNLPSLGTERLPDTGESYFYPEWDYQKKQLLDRHCVLNVSRAEDFSHNKHLSSEDVLSRNSDLIEFWKNKMASLVNSNKWVDRQFEGSELSIDHFVRFVSDLKTNYADPRFYLQMQRKKRDFSSVILLDQSLSTDSWVLNRRVLDVEIESLLICSELLKDLGEETLVAGTYSQTRSNCHFIQYKGFQETWGSFQSQILNARPSGYTRLGPAIRHSTELLSKTGSKQKVLILMTDGKPTDYDRYEGRYGIEDIRHAILEAEQKNVSIRAIAIEKSAKDYFPYLFGSGSFHVLHDPAMLPEYLLKLYLSLLKR